MDIEQRGVARGAAAALMLTGLVYLAAITLPPLALPASDTFADRLTLTLRADLVPLLWLIAAIANVANGRFWSPTGIAGFGFGEPSPRIAIGCAILQNTHEQVTLAVGVHLALATLLPYNAMGLIPLLVVLFSLGRLLFWTGYARGAAARAFGFGATFYPTVLGTFLCLGLLIPR